MRRRKGKGERGSTALPTSHLSLPVVALVGRPNVGKSTLWNRICGSHHAIVEDEPGVTRDRRYGDAEWEGRLFRVVDTGGLDPASFRRGDDPIARGIYRQAMRAVEEADLVVFVIDARAGLSAGDRDAADIVRKTGRPLLFAANKVDGAAHEAEAHELYKLGADQVFPISAQHGRGVGELLDAILARLPSAPKVEYPPEPGDEDADGDAPPPDARASNQPLRIAIVGRPNAGKSSLLNHFAHDERVLVDAQAGTTRDPVDLAVEIEGRPYIFIDTAGIRRRARVHAPMEKVAVAMAEKAINRADVCVLLIDVTEGIGEQDAKIAGLCDDAGRALVIAFNKIDLVDEGLRKRQEQLHEDVQRQLQFVPWAKVEFLSAQTGKGAQKLLHAVNAAYAAFTTRVGTGALNRWFSTIVEKHPPSLYRGKPVRLYYIQQPQASPPTFILSVNHADGVHFSYRRYLQNQLREAFHLDGTPVRIVCRGKGEKAGDQAKRKELVPRGAKRPRAHAD